jgi:hypothetical protein
MREAINKGSETDPLNDATNGNAPALDGEHGWMKKGCRKENERFLQRITRITRMNGETRDEEHCWRRLPVLHRLKWLDCAGVYS